MDASKKVVLCQKPQPKGFYCTRPEAHPGPCAVARKRRWYDGLGEAIGEVLFGGNR
jgi:hypothetical protein